MIKELHQKFESRMLLNRKDPFTMLPFEIAAMVIQHFSFKQIVGILRVCKKWERFFGCMQHLWMKIDLSGARGKVPWTSVRSYIRRSKAMVRHATIKNLSSQSVPKVMEFLSRCPQLEHLELWVDWNYKNFFETFKGCKQLKSITLSPDIAIPHDYLGRLLLELPHLEHVALWSVRPTGFAFVESGQWPKFLPNLKSITLATQQPANVLLFPALGIPGLGETGSEDQPLVYPNLEEIRLDWDPPRYQFHLFPRFHGPLPPLRRLELRGLSIEREFMEKMPDSLEYLCFQGGSSAGLDEIIPRKHPFPNLHTLIFRDSGWITTEIFYVFLCHAPRLRTLHIDQCFNLSFDTIITSTCSVTESIFRNLVDLNMASLRKVDDDKIPLVAQKMRNLKSLNLSHTNITGCTVRMLADALHHDGNDLCKLDHLNVWGCEGVSWDAFSYGRMRGLDVMTGRGDLSKIGFG